MIDLPILENTKGKINITSLLNSSRKASLQILCTPGEASLYVVLSNVEQE